MDTKELKIILDQHKLYVESGGKKGKRADLIEANLSEANLYKANLYETKF